MSSLQQTSADFFARDGLFVELARVGGNSTLGYVLKERGKPFHIGRTAEISDYRFVPPEEDEFTRHIRFAEALGDEVEVRQLLTEVDAFLRWCIELDDRRRFLLACFVLSTWVVDWLPVAPYVALVGLPGSGKSTALRALYLICRRGLMTYDISSAAFYRACDRFVPTLCIDEAATAGEKKALYHLLRSGTTRDAAAFRVGQSYRAYGAKVVSWNEMPDDAALNSRCIIIPMKESSRSFPRTTDPEVIEEASYLQGELLNYRFEHCGAAFPGERLGQQRLHSRDRDLYEALALPLYEDRLLGAALLECFDYQQNVNQDPLPPKQVAVLQGLFKQIHIQPDREDHALSQIKNQVNLSLALLGERFRLHERAVSEILKTFGYVDRKRTMSGWTVLVDSAARKRLHELLWLNGVVQSATLPAGVSGETCEFCNLQRTREDDVQEKSPPFNRERWAYTRKGDDRFSPPEKRRRAAVEEEERERVELWTEQRREWEHSVLDPSEFPRHEDTLETLAETDEVSEPPSNGSGNGNGAAPSRPPVSVSAERPGGTGKTQGVKPEEPASRPPSAGEQACDVGQPTESNEHNEHNEHENGTGTPVRPSSSQFPDEFGTAQGPGQSEPHTPGAGEKRPSAGTTGVADSHIIIPDENQLGNNRGDSDMDTEDFASEYRRDRPLREQILHDVMNPSEEEIEEETRKWAEQENKSDRPRPGKVGEEP